jgi:hypothetical protein
MGNESIPQAVSTTQRTPREYARQQDYYMEITVDDRSVVPCDDTYGVDPREDCDVPQVGR